MTVRQWTQEDLDRVYPEVKAAGWEWMAGGSDVLAWRRTDHCIVQVSIVNGSHVIDRHPYDRTPVPVDVSLAVILANKGLDSLGEMAAHADDEEKTARESKEIFRSGDDDASADNEAGQARAWAEAAAMLRRRTVKP